MPDKFNLSNEIFNEDIVDNPEDAVVRVGSIAEFLRLIFEDIRLSPNRDDKVRSNIKILDGGGIGKQEVREIILRRAGQKFQDNSQSEAHKEMGSRLTSPDTSQNHTQPEEISESEAELQPSQIRDETSGGDSQNRSPETAPSEAICKNCGHLKSEHFFRFGKGICTAYLPEESKKRGFAVYCSCVDFQPAEEKRREE